MLIAIFVMAGAAAQAPQVNPLAPAEQGMVQCWSPDISKKTCWVIASYRKIGPGTYDEDAIVGLSPEGPLTAETHTPVSVKADAVCAAIRTQEVRAGILRKGQNIVSLDDARPILDRVATLVVTLEGQETCTRYSSVGGKLVAKLSISGSYRPEHDIEVEWISPTDGYTATP